MRFGVSVENVVATMDIPSSHQGIALPERKNSVVFLPARLGLALRVVTVEGLNSRGGVWSRGASAPFDVSTGTTDLFLYISVRDRFAKEGDDGVTFIFVNRAAMFVDHFGHDFQIGVKQTNDFFG